MINESKASPAKSNMWKKILIIVAVIVILTAVAIIAPRISRYLMKSRSMAAQNAITGIRKSVDTYWQSNGKMSGFTIENAIIEAKLSKKIIKDWNFVVVWKPGEIYTKELVDKLSNVKTNEYVYVAPFQMIFATATKNNPIGEGIKIWLDGDSNMLHGYGIDKEVEPDWAAIFPNP